MSNFTQILNVYLKGKPNPVVFSSSGSGGNYVSGIEGQLKHSLGYFEPVSIEKTRDLNNQTVSIKIPRIDVSAIEEVMDHLTNALLMQNIVIRLELQTDDNDALDMYYGKVGKVEFDETSITLECNSFLNLLDYGRSFRLSKSCRNQLYDNKCGVDPNNPSWFTTVQITSIDGDRFAAVTNISLPFNQYRNGFIEIPAYDNLRVEVALNNTGNLFFYTQLPPLVTTGVPYKLLRGCAKDTATCSTVFSNILNFGGVPTSPNFFPGSEAAVSGTNELRDDAQ